MAICSVSMCGIRRIYIDRMWSFAGEEDAKHPGLHEGMMVKDSTCSVSMLAVAL